MKKGTYLTFFLGLLTFGSEWAPATSALVYLNVTKSAQVITSPNYPSDYPNNAVEDWIITASSTAWVVINLINIRMQSGTPCPDILIVGDQTQSWNRSTCSATFTGLQSYLAQNKMYLNFTSDASITAPGFLGLLVEAPNQNFIWNVLPTSTCQNDPAIVFLAQYYDTQYFTLPLWPNAYKDSVTCNWEMTAPPEYTIWLRRFKFDLGPGDSLKIWNGKRSYIFCEDLKWEGNLTEVEEFVSKGDNIYIRFESDGSGSSEGFYIGFEAIRKGDKIPTNTTCDGEGIELLVSLLVVGCVLLILIIALLIWAKKTNRICVPKTHPVYRPDTPVIFKEPSYIRPETPPPPPKAPPRYARANQPKAQHIRF